jgi:phosphoribosylformylglycinamidine synthase
MRAIMPKPNRTADQSAPKWLTKHNAADVLMALLGHPNIASKASVIHRYDHEIRGATAVRPLVGQVGDGHGDGVVIAEPLDDFGFSIGIGVNPWFGIHDAERMALACIDEAMRNVVAVGADPDKAVLLDNFSWGDPRRETTLGELAAAVDGCVAGAHAFAAPFVSGKDSLNNEYLGSDGERHSVPPTLVITAVAHVPNANRTVTADLKTAGNTLILVGRTLPEFGGSHAAMVCNAQSTCVPTFDEQSPANYRAVHALMLQQKIRACHDCSEGGLAVTVAEMAMAGRLGAALRPNSEVHAHLFSESLGRLVLEVEAAHVSDVLAAIPGAHIIGSVTTTPFLVLPDNSALSIEAMLNVWQAPQ